MRKVLKKLLVSRCGRWALLPYGLVFALRSAVQTLRAIGPWALR